MLSDRSWPLHQHALEAFSHFAEITNHEEVISQSLCVEETKAKVVNYLSKTVNAREHVESRLQRIKLEKAVIEKHNERLESDKENASDRLTAEAGADSEPCPKKARQEFCAEEEFSRYVTTAESALKALQALTERTSPPTPPPWLESRLQELQTILTHIRTATHTS